MAGEAVIAGRPDLIRTIEHAAHLLPSQGPITVFVHHNTLHAFEHLPFDEGVKAGGRVFGCHAYLPEDRYRQNLQHGRIRVEDLADVLIDDLGDEADRLVANFGTRHAIRLAMLQFPLRTGSGAELRWVIAETDALRLFREEVPDQTRSRMIAETRQWVIRELKNDGANQTVLASGTGTSEPFAESLASFHRWPSESWNEKTWEAFTLSFLWRVCHSGVRSIETVGENAAELERKRDRDLLLEATGEDTDILVHEILIRFCSSFLDQGFAQWGLPNEQAGFYRSFLRLYGKSLMAPTRWLADVRRELRRLSESNTGPLESIEESLGLLGVGDQDRERFLTQSLLALRGWAGMVWQMESNAEWAPHPAPAGSLVEFVAVRLILDRLAIAHVAGESLGLRGPLDKVRDAALRSTSKRRVERSR